jgi:autotransporter-associated beta strand protein
MATLALFVAPSHAEQQLFDFYVNGAASNDATNPAFGGPQTGFSTGCCRTYYGPGQGPHDAPVLPGGFVTTSSGPGAVSEAGARAVGTKGHPVTGVQANDAYDGYGEIGFRQNGTIVSNYGGLTVTRQVDATHGADGGTTPITANFAIGGVANAVRWVETITNTTSAPISGSMAYFNNLGSDSATKWVGSSSGNNLATTGNLWLTSIQQGAPSDPVITHIFGNNAYTATVAQMIHADGNDKPEWQYPITVAPGQTKMLVLFNVLTADIDYSAATVASDIALGGQLASFITNNGAPIAADSVPFQFFADMTRDQLMSIINYSFVGLTIDLSRPFFTETDYAVAQPSAIFDGGTLKPTTAVNFGQNFVLNTAGGTVDNSNGSLTFNGVFSGTGPLTFAGTNSTTLANTNTYTGLTSVNGGILLVNGSIATSSLTTVNTGGTLGGAGTVGNTLVAGGIFAPGNGTPVSSMTVNGNLAFQSAGTYLVQINPATSSFANVTGTATLGGAALNAIYANGSYVDKNYTILTANNVVGTFGSVINTNLPSGFHATLGYDATHAYLDLALNFRPSNVNQQNVANAISGFFSSSGQIPLVFGGLKPAGLTQVSGETGTASQQTTFQAMSQFMGVITDPFVAGRGAPISAGDSAPAFADEGLAYAESGKARSNSERDAYAAVYRKAPATTTDTLEQRWSVWATGFGGSQTTDGNAIVGSNNAVSSVYGTAIGADYRFSPDTLAGFAMAGGGTNFSIGNGLGSGRSDLFQAGAFARHNIGPAYLTGALAYGWQDVTTDRTVNVAGADHLRAEFNADAWSGRLEGGYRFVARGFGFTPYAAGQFTTFDLPSYAEQAVAGATTFALAYDAKSVTDARAELGLRTDKSFAVQDGILTLRGRAAWAHDFNPDRSIAATFQTLPGASFGVNGAAQAPDSALTTASAEMKWLNGWSAAATFEGEFSDATRSYAGMGTVRYIW